MCGIERYLCSLPSLDRLSYMLAFLFCTLCFSSGHKAPDFVPRCSTYRASSTCEAKVLKSKSAHETSSLQLWHSQKSPCSLMFLWLSFLRQRGENAEKIHPSPFLSFILCCFQLKLIVSFLSFHVLMTFMLSPLSWYHHYILRYKITRDIMQGSRHNIICFFGSATRAKKWGLLISHRARTTRPGDYCGVPSMYTFRKMSSFKENQLTWHHTLFLSPGSSQICQRLGRTQGSVLTSTQQPPMSKLSIYSSETAVKLHLHYLVWILPFRSDKCKSSGWFLINITYIYYLFYAGC